MTQQLARETNADPQIQHHSFKRPSNHLLASSIYWTHSILEETSVHFGLTLFESTHILDMDLPFLFEEPQTASLSIGLQKV